MYLKNLIVSDFKNLFLRDDKYFIVILDVVKISGFDSLIEGWSSS